MDVLEKEKVEHTFVTKIEAKNFKLLYNNCSPGETFVFKGHEFLYEYAKYLIQYLETKFGELWGISAF